MPELSEYKDKVLRTWECDSEDEATRLLRSLRENDPSHFYRLSASEDPKKWTIAEYVPEVALIDLKEKYDVDFAFL